MRIAIGNDHIVTDVKQKLSDFLKLRATRSSTKAPTTSPEHTTLSMVRRSQKT